MKINNQELNIEELVKVQETSFLKRRENGLLLSDEDISILKRNGINYLNYNNLKSLLFAIEEVLENEEMEELEELSLKLGEYNYYNYTNK
ncbi:MAG: hypothetical protein IJZ36_05125 [Bacilli bacterium]|nr:hypothetical protein [Bacilli bacterium]